MFLTETKLTELDHVEIGGYEFACKCRKSRTPSGGVCLAIRNELFKNCEILESRHDYIHWCRIKSSAVTLHKDIICGVVYIPPESSRYSDISLFDDLENDIAEWRNKYDCYFCIAGDFNAHTGENPDFFEDVANVDNSDNDSRLTLPSRSSQDNMRINNYGNRLLELCSSLGIYIVNGRCGKDCGIGKTTCVDCSVDDYFLLSFELFDSVVDFEVESFNPLFSDKHNSLSLFGNFLNSPTEKVVMQNTAGSNDSVVWRNDKKEDFVQNLDESVLNDLRNWANKNLGRVELDVAELDSILEMHNKLFKDSSVKTFGRPRDGRGRNTPNGNNKPWYNDKCKEQKRVFNTARERFKRVNTQENASNVKVECRKYKKILRKSYKDYTTRMVEDLKSLKENDVHKFWKIVNSKQNRESIPENMVNDFYQHFKNLNAGEVEEQEIVDWNLEEDDFLNRRIEKNEILKAINRLKSRKAAGVDQILNEFIKSSAHVLIDFYVSLFNIVLDTGAVPSCWTQGIIKPVYKKKGDRKLPENYRGITLLSCMGKLFTAVLNKRVEEFVKLHDCIGKEQAGFRAGFSTLDHVFTLQCLVDLYLCKGKKLYAAFVDFKQAFDGVWRVGLWRKMLQSGVNGKVLRVIRNMYEAAKSCVRVGNVRSEFFSCNTGVRQGENLSPILFSFFLNDFDDFLAAHNFNGPSDLNATCRCEFLENLEIFLRLAVLLYADDMILLANSPEGLQQGLDLLEEYCDNWKLTVNSTKTKVVIFSRGKQRRNLPVFSYGDIRLEIVDEYLYLGVLFSYNGRLQRAINRCYQKGLKSMFGVLRTCRKLNLPIDLSLELFDKVVLPVMLYGCEVWGAGNTKMVEKVHLKFCKYLLNLSIRTPSAIVYGELGRFPIEIEIKTRMVSFWSRLLEPPGIDKWSTTFCNISCEHTEHGYITYGWSTEIRNILNECGLGGLWYDPLALKTPQLKTLIRQRLRDQFLQKWWNDIETDDRCNFYKIIKTEFGNEVFLKKLVNFDSLCKFRSGCSIVPLARKRLYSQEIRENTCTLCNQTTFLDEIHYICTCPYFTEIRMELYPSINENLPREFQIVKIKNIFATKSKIKLQKLVRFCTHISLTLRG